MRLVLDSGADFWQRSIVHMGYIRMLAVY